MYWSFKSSFRTYVSLQWKFNSTKLHKTTFLNSVRLIIHQFTSYFYSYQIEFITICNLKKKVKSNLVFYYTILSWKKENLHNSLAISFCNATSFISNILINLDFYLVKSYIHRKFHRHCTNCIETHLIRKYLYTYFTHCVYTTCRLFYLMTESNYNCIAKLFFWFYNIWKCTHRILNIIIFDGLTSTLYEYTFQIQIQFTHQISILCVHAHTHIWANFYSN